MSANKYLSLLTSLCGAGIVYQAAKLSKVSSIDPVGSSLYPTGLGLVLVILGVLLFLFNIKELPSKIESNQEKGNWSSLVLITICSVLYIIFLEWLGFVISTIMLLYAINKVLGETRWKVAIGFSVIFSLVLYALFKGLLGILLPPIPFL